MKGNLSIQNQVMLDNSFILRVLKPHNMKYSNLFKYLSLLIRQQFSNLGILMALMFIGIACQSTSPKTSSTELSQIDSELEVLLDKWYPAVLDTINGGYYSTFTHDWQLAEQQPKTLLNHARTLWTVSKAYQFYPARKLYKNIAKHGYQYLITHLYDSINSGFFSDYPFQKEKPKNTYENAFAIYALSEYAKIDSNPAIKDHLNKAFNWFETKAHDPEFLGYYHFVFDEQNRNDFKSYKFLQSSGWGNADWKNQNTSIHILEAFTNLYQVQPSILVKKRLEEIFLLVRDKMVLDENHLALYFLPDWTPISHQESTRQYILENKQFDHISFGHDIETAFLLLEASEVLYGKYDTITLRIAKNLTDHSLEHGMDTDNYGMFYEGYRFNPDSLIEIINNQKAWWVQAEAWHTCRLIQKIYPNETRYQQAGDGIWQYILEQQLDKEYGGWYSNGLDTRPESKKANKGHPWKNAYHNGRALMQVLELNRKTKTSVHDK